MSLSDDLDQLASSTRCLTCEWCASRTPEEQDSLAKQMAGFSDGTRQARYGRYVDLYKVCTRHGLQADIDQFRHHCRTHVVSN